MFTGAGTGSSRGRRRRQPMASFDESLRVMDADSRVKFAKLSKELTSLRAQVNKKRLYLFWTN